MEGRTKLLKCSYNLLPAEASGFLQGWPPFLEAVGRLEKELMYFTSPGTAVHLGVVSWPLCRAHEGAPREQR